MEEMQLDDLHTLVDNLILPELTICLERPSEESDFQELIPIIERGFETLLLQTSLIKPIKFEVLSSEQKHTLTLLLLLCGEHSDNNKNWTSNNCIKSSDKLQLKLCEVFLCQNITELIHYNFKNCLIELSKKLIRDKWRMFPGAVQSFSWLLNHLEESHIGENLNLIFPAVLLLLDDFDPENKILGCNLMTYVINNSARFELRRQSYDDVLYETLHKMMYLRELDLIVPLVTCISTLLNKIKLKHQCSLEMGKFDKSFVILLQQMEMEQVLTFRKQYSIALSIMIKSGDINLLYWSQRLFRIFTEYLTMEDDYGGLTQINTLQAMLWFIKQTWMRTHRHVSQLLSSLLKLLHDITQPVEILKIHSDKKSELMDLLEQCLSLIANIAPEQVKKELENSETLPFGDEFHLVLNRAVLTKINKT